ncbi:MAG: fluoride efflux transporter CrcB [Synergistaceae bacterium]|nr:fluoride efflux transporter CrcB [Synergistaceae bacterium]
MAVAIGGALGACARYFVSQWAASRLGADFPYGTLLVNVVGCFLLGLFLTLATERIIVNPYWRLLVAVGFLGSLTTFSSFSYETLRLLDAAGLLSAISNAALNVCAGLLAAWAGIALSRVL